MLLKLDKPSAKEESQQGRKFAKSAGAPTLYNASLNYRTDMTKHIAKSVEKDMTYIKVGAMNDYPTVMVHFDAKTLCGGKFKCTDTAKYDFNHFLMSHYTGIVNAEAAKMGITTPMVERSSFGHASPSIAPTKASFRINLGMMPPKYAEIHIKALRQLDADLKQFKTAIDQPNGEGTLADFENLANSPKKEALGKAKNILELALSPAEGGGKSLITNAVRRMESRNSVDSNSYNRHIPPGASSTTAIHDSLKALFKEVQYTEKSGGGLAMSTDAKATAYDMTVGVSKDSAAKLSEDTRTDPGLDTSYVNYLKGFREKFGAVAESLTAEHSPETPTELRETREKVRKTMEEVRKTLHPDNEDIAGATDIANQLLKLYTLEKVENRVKNDDVDVGYGSGSDIEDGGVSGHKITTHNGMRALITAVSAVNMANTKKDVSVDMSIAYDNPYFETEAAIGKLEPKIAEADASTATIGLKDINACIINGDSSVREKTPIAQQFPNARIWIIDSTSATTDRMREIYQEFKETNKAELLFFAESGLKNQQGGADSNNYGTVRVFAKTPRMEVDQTSEMGADESQKMIPEEITEIIGEIENTDKGLALFSHEYRRTMKEMGFVPTNHDIVTADPGKELEV